MNMRWMWGIQHVVGSLNWSACGAEGNLGNCTVNGGKKLSKNKYLVPLGKLYSMGTSQGKPQGMGEGYWEFIGDQWHFGAAAGGQRRHAEHPKGNCLPAHGQLDLTTAVTDDMSGNQLRNYKVIKKLLRHLHEDICIYMENKSMNFWWLLKCLTASHLGWRCPSMRDGVPWPCVISARPLWCI